MTKRGAVKLGAREIPAARRIERDRPASPYVPICERLTKEQAAASRLRFFRFKLGKEPRK